MKYLLLMRHAKSSWDEPYLTDHQRPLARRGIRDSSRMGKHIHDLDLIPDHIMCSTAQRTRQTLELFLETCPVDGEVTFMNHLYHADYLTYLELLRSEDPLNELVMILGHNPEMDEFLEMICDVDEHMVTGAIAYIQFSIQEWGELNEAAEGELIDIWRPRDL